MTSPRTLLLHAGGTIGMAPSGEGAERCMQLALETLDGALRATGEVAWAPQLKAGLELRLEGLNPGTQFLGARA